MGQASKTWWVAGPAGSQPCSGMERRHYEGAGGGVNGPHFTNCYRLLRGGGVFCEGCEGCRQRKLTRKCLILLGL